ncbi:hypothetical protein [Paenibacillus sp. SI8]|uniref:hypothetical protein n=1 Tax=unclassified Paenibacillus TaxID=185978 RepID=UPI0034655CDA
MPSDIFNQKKQCFLNGYLTEYAISEDFSAIMPACRRFANLYGYIRCLRSMSEKWANEPEWLINLREMIIKSMDEESLCFGMEIH